VDYVGEKYIWVCASLADSEHETLLTYSKEAHIQLINADSETDGRISSNVALLSRGVEHRGISEWYFWILAGGIR